MLRVVVAVAASLVPVLSGVAVAAGKPVGWFVPLGPRNHVALEPVSGYLFIAGGIGITPLLPMISEAERSGTPWRVRYGGQTGPRMAFAGTLVTTFPDRVTLLPGRARAAGHRRDRPHRRGEHGRVLLRPGRTSPAW